MTLEANKATVLAMYSDAVSNPTDPLTAEDVKELEALKEELQEGLNAINLDLAEANHTVAVLIPVPAELIHPSDELPEYDILATGHTEEEAWATAAKRVTMLQEHPGKDQIQFEPIL